MKENKELNQQIRNISVDKNGRPTIDIDERKSIYKSISEALKAIPITNRNVGLTISIYDGIKVVEYWWEKGIKDSDLVKKINTNDIHRIDAKLVDLQNQIDGINNIEFKVFDNLPELGDSNIIYVIPNTTSQDDDDFIEYFWIKSQQRYERFGGLNVDGGVTINNIYTFDTNVFNLNEDSDIKNVSLNSKKIKIDSDGISIYKYDIEEENNERHIYIGNYSRHVGTSILNGGCIVLDGSFSGRNIENRDFKFNLYPNNLSIEVIENEITTTSLLSAKTLTIEQDINKSIITYNGIYLTEDTNNIFEASAEKLYIDTDEIELYSNIGFNINYNDNFGIKGFSDNNIEQILLYSSNNKIIVTNDEISLQKGNNTNKFIKINNDDDIILKNGICEIHVNNDDSIQLKGYNGSYFVIDTDGWCIMKGYATSKVGLVGTNNEQSYFVVEEGEYTLPDIKIQQNLENYIYLYKNNDLENHIIIKSEYFRFIDISNNILFTIDSDGDSNWNLSNEFKWSLGSNKTVKIVATGIEYFDGTNTYTKTWAQIFS